MELFANEVYYIFVYARLHPRNNLLYMYILQKIHVLLARFSPYPLYLFALIYIRLFGLYRDVKKRNDLNALITPHHGFCSISDVFVYLRDCSKYVRLYAFVLYKQGTVWCTYGKRKCTHLRWKIYWLRLETTDRVPRFGGGILSYCIASP